MIVIDNENVCFVDVDETLVMHLRDYQVECELIYNPYDKNHVWVKRHVANIKLVMQMHTRGRCIVVWSQAGPRWAESVVRALGLEDVVTLIVAKPICYVDDLDCSKFMTQRIYLEDK